MVTIWFSGSGVGVTAGDGVGDVHPRQAQRER
jgi:hypothetical protein